MYWNWHFASFLLLLCRFSHVRLCAIPWTAANHSSVPGVFQARILDWVAISFSNACMHTKLLQLYPTLCNPMDSSTPGSSLHGILQARILEWVAISFSNACMHTKSPQSCPTLCDPMDSSSPGSSVHGILQARILEWVAISSYLSLTALSKIWHTFLERKITQVLGFIYLLGMTTKFAYFL